MMINSKSDITDSFIPSGISTRNHANAKDLFAKHLEIQMQSAEVAEPQEEKRPNRFAGDIADIKEIGLTAYVMDLEKEKLEEIRKEILERMGLTEGDLGKLSSEQRAMIEKMITREIQTRIAATSLEKTDDADNKVQKTDQILPGVRPDFAFLPMMEQGKNDPLGNR